MGRGAGVSKIRHGVLKGYWGEVGEGGEGEEGGRGGEGRENGDFAVFHR